MPLHGMLTSTWDHIQGFLFPMLREEVGPLTAQHERLVVVLGMARIEAFVRMWPSLPGRPQDDRHALARAFVAKAVLNLATTSGLPGGWLSMPRCAGCAAGSGRAQFRARAPSRAPSPSLLRAVYRAGSTRP
jgi:hypothetical protein